MANCRFCDIVQGKVLDYIVWQDDKFLAFLEINPAKPGHCMLIPKKHIDYFFDMDNQLYVELFMTAKRLQEQLRKATGAKRIGIAVVGFDVPHAHLHLVPLHGSNELFDPKKFYRAKPEELKTLQGRLYEALKNATPSN